jgi:SAM-dependent methyltransferase
MADRQFTDPDIAELYDLFHPPQRRADFGFYLPLILESAAVLDAGCGTGALLHSARQAGHAGRLSGLDPAEGMLGEARRRTDIEWVCGELGGAPWDAEFDLVVMTGHAFQVLVDDHELRSGLAAVHRVLAPGGTFAFETRNPAARAWLRWTPEHAVEIRDGDGSRIRLEHRLHTPVEGELVTFTTTFTHERWAGPLTSRSTLRFLPPHTLHELLEETGFAVEHRYGDWDLSPLTGDSPEIITLARRR